MSAEGAVLTEMVWVDMAGSAGPAGLTIIKRYLDHALTGMAIECRAFGPPGVATVRLANGRIRTVGLHWYEAHGVGKRKMKIKRYLD